jgi:hypothetical protein
MAAEVDLMVAEQTGRSKQIPSAGSPLDKHFESWWKWNSLRAILERHHENPPSRRQSDPGRSDGTRVPGSHLPPF